MEKKPSQTIRELIEAELDTVSGGRWSYSNRLEITEHDTAQDISYLHHLANLMGENPSLPQFNSVSNAEAIELGGHPLI